MLGVCSVRDVPTHAHGEAVQGLLPASSSWETAPAWGQDHPPLDMVVAQPEGGWKKVFDFILKYDWHQTLKTWLKMKYLIS